MTTPAAIEAKKMMVLDAVRYQGASLAKACRAAGVSYQTIASARKADDEFAAALQSAEMERADILEDAAFDRAVNGVVHERLMKDGSVIETVKYSDALLAKLMDGANPSKYAQRTKTELTGKDGEPLHALDDTAVAAKISAFVELAAQRKEAAEKDG